MLPHSNDLFSVTIYSYLKTGANGRVNKNISNIRWIRSGELGLDKVSNNEVSNDVVDNMVPIYPFLKCWNNSLYNLKRTL